MIKTEKLHILGKSLLMSSLLLLSQHKLAMNNSKKVIMFWICVPIAYLTLNFILILNMCVFLSLFHLLHEQVFCIYWIQRNLPMLINKPAQQKKMTKKKQKCAALFSMRISMLCCISNCFDFFLWISLDKI